MEAITGVFKTRADAERAVHEALQAGFAEDKITLLTPGSVEHVEKEIHSVPSEDAEAPGMGEAMGALAGGGVAFAAGTILMALVPGLGPVTAVGLLGAAILGAAGATVGAVAGEKAEEAADEGLPADEIFVYEDALRKGRSAVIAMADDDDSASQIRGLLKKAGAESVDAAREQWWIGLRSAEQERYSASGRSFVEDEQYFRMGFEAAMHARTRCMEFDQVSAEMDALLEDVKRQYPGKDVEAPFTRGYQRGREHYQQLCDETSKAA